MFSKKIEALTLRCKKIRRQLTHLVLTVWDFVWDWALRKLIGGFQS